MRNRLLHLFRVFLFLCFAINVAHADSGRVSPQTMEKYHKANGKFEPAMFIFCLTMLFGTVTANASGGD